ncbi:MAG: LysR family transcriptional regulator [Betaproteobacteria bacterium]|nr:LysR family transcriptional regulator [Betaproteobacteria bacterium]
MTLAKTANIKQLITFQKVARLGNVSLAAEELFLSQSATSIQLSNLEDAVGTKLLNRTGRGIRLTEAGEVLYTLSERVLNVWQEVSDEMESYLGDFTGTLRIGAVTTAEYWLPHVLVNFANANPKVKLKLQVANRDEVVRYLAANEIDLAVMGRAPQEVKVKSTSFANNPTAFLAAPSHVLMHTPGLNLEMLANSQMLVREKGSGARASLERIFRTAGLKLSMGAELSSNESIKQLCIAGLGPAYLSLQSCLLEIRAGLLSVLPLANNPMNRRWHVVHLENKPLSQVATVFMEHLIRHGQADIERQLELMSKIPLDGMAALHSKPEEPDALSP